MSVGPGGGVLEAAISDDVLVDRVRAGDVDAFGDLVARYRPWLTARCRRHLGGDAHAAEDVAQECFVALQRTLHGGSAPLRLRPWLTVVARNRCIDETRKLRAVPTADLPERAASDAGSLASVTAFAPASGTEDEYLERAWSALTGRHRAVLELREVGGLSYEEIAASLAVTAGAVEALLFRARTALRREYARAGGRVAAMAPMEEVVQRAAGRRGILSRVGESGSRAFGDVAGARAHGAVPGSGGSGGSAGALTDLQARLLGAPGMDRLLAGAASGSGSGRLRGLLAGVALLVGSVGAAATTIDAPAPNPPPAAPVPTAPEPSAPAVDASVAPPAAPEADASAEVSPDAGAPPPAPDAPPAPDDPSAAGRPTVPPVPLPPTGELVDPVARTAADAVDAVAGLLTRAVPARR